MSKYDTEVDSSNLNTSHGLILHMAGHNKRVLDVGCASGYIARELVLRSCQVSGVEYDGAAAEEARPSLDKLVVGDLEQIDLVQEFGEASFDVVIFGDVLEHLRDPAPPLRQATRLLRQGGQVVLSVPNVAHGAVRLALLRGQFDYRSLGLLDSTHLRFFTRNNLTALLDETGLVPVDFRRTTAGVFETEIGVKPEDYDAKLVDEIMLDPEATTYQFVIKAIPDNGDASIRRLADQVQRAHEEKYALQLRLVKITDERNQLGQIAHDMRTSLEATQAAADDATARAARAEARLTDLALFTQARSTRGSSARRVARASRDWVRRTLPTRSPQA